MKTRRHAHVNETQSTVNRWNFSIQMHIIHIQYTYIWWTNIHANTYVRHHHMILYFTNDFLCVPVHHASAVYPIIKTKCKSMRVTLSLLFIIDCYCEHMVPFDFLEDVKYTKKGTKTHTRSADRKGYMTHLSHAMNLCLFILFFFLPSISCDIQKNDRKRVTEWKTKQDTTKFTADYVRWQNRAKWNSILLSVSINNVRYIHFGRLIRRLISERLKIVCDTQIFGNIE